MVQVMQGVLPVPHRPNPNEEEKVGEVSGAQPMEHDSGTVGAVDGIEGLGLYDLRGAITNTLRQVDVMERALRNNGIWSLICHERGQW